VLKQAREDQREENNLPKLHEDQQQGRMLVIDEARTACEILAVAKELTAGLTSSSVKTLLENNGCHPDEVWRKSGGEFVAARGFFYTHGYDELKWAAAVEDALKKSGMTFQMIDNGMEWRDFRGGAPLRRQSHWWAKFKITDGLKTARSRMSEQGDHVIAETYCTGDPVSILAKARGQVLNANFLVVCEHGDWSGFMPLRQALQELDKLNTRKHYKYFAVVER
jgi:hypothetical protein